MGQNNICCSICGSKQSLILKDKILKMYECNACNHAFCISTKTGKFNYTNDYYEDTHANWFDHPNYWLFDFIYSNVCRLKKEQGLRVFDIGCGKGDFLKFLKKKAMDVELWGIDLSNNQFPGINFIKGDFLEKSFDVKFDVVCSLAAIEHVADVRLFIKKIKHILMPQAIVVIMTDNTGGIFYRFARILKRIGFKTPFYSLYEVAHLQAFTNKSLKILMDLEGLAIISQTNHNYPVEAVNLPKTTPFMKYFYLLGIRILFSLPRQYGVLQTIICKNA